MLPASRRCYSAFALAPRGRASPAGTGCPQHRPSRVSRPRRELLGAEDTAPLGSEVCGRAQSRSLIAGPPELAQAPAALLSPFAAVISASLSPEAHAAREQGGCALPCWRHQGEGAWLVLILLLPLSSAEK